MTRAALKLSKLLILGSVAHFSDHFRQLWPFIKIPKYFCIAKTKARNIYKQCWTGRKKDRGNSRFIIVKRPKFWEKALVRFFDDFIRGLEMTSVIQLFYLGMVKFFGHRVFCWISEPKKFSNLILSVNI